MAALALTLTQDCDFLTTWEEDDDDFNDNPFWKKPDPEDPTEYLFGCTIWVGFRATIVCVFKDKEQIEEDAIVAIKLFVWDRIIGGG